MSEYDKKPDTEPNTSNWMDDPIEARRFYIAGAIILVCAFVAVITEFQPVFTFVALTIVLLLLGFPDAIFSRLVPNAKTSKTNKEKISELEVKLEREKSITELEAKIQTEKAMRRKYQSMAGKNDG